MRALVLLVSIAGCVPSAPRETTTPAVTDGEPEASGMQCTTSRSRDTLASCDATPHQCRTLRKQALARIPDLEPCRPAPFTVWCYGTSPTERVCAPSSAACYAMSTGVCEERYSATGNTVATATSPPVAPPPAAPKTDDVVDLMKDYGSGDGPEQRDPPWSPPTDGVNYGKRPANPQAIVKAWAVKGLLDPRSAQYGRFSHPRQEHVLVSREEQTALYGWSVCVDVNAKNSFGGYTGVKTLWFLIREGAVIQEQDLADNNGFIDHEHRATCEDP